MVEIIGDPGSCHMGDLDRAKRLIQMARDAGIDAVKFQFLGDPEIVRGNIPILWRAIADFRDEMSPFRVFASAFTRDAVRFLRAEGFPEIKFAYSAWDLFRVSLCDGLLDSFDRIYVSTDVIRPRPVVPPSVRWLYCIPEYPVKYAIDFEGVFPRRFQGFSDHTLGITQTQRAVAAGARIIEKHFTLDEPEIDCPDHRFALRPEMLRALVESVR